MARTGGGGGGGGTRRTRILARYFADGLNQSLSSSVATPNGELTCRLINLLLSSLFQMLTYSVGVEF